MHPNPVFRKMPRDANLAFARDRSFGILSVNGASGPLLSHVPFALNEEGTIAALHLVRSNPILRNLDQPCPAVIAVSGPDGYVSPDWYGIDNQVPTWNYVAVHLRGTLERRPDAVLPDALGYLSHQFESRIPFKDPWTMDKMDPEALSRMLRMIVPVRLTVESIEGTWKLGQNKPDEVRAAAAEMLGFGQGQELSRLSALMGAIGEVETE